MFATNVGWVVKLIEPNCGERERERERQRETERDRQRETETETDRQAGRQTEGWGRVSGSNITWVW